MKQYRSIGSSASTSMPMSSVQERLFLLRKTYADIVRKEKEAKSSRYHRALHGPAYEIHLRLYREGLESMQAVKKMQKKYSSCDSSSCYKSSSTVDSRAFGSGNKSVLYKEGLK